jgi:hypothetical protein
MKTKTLLILMAALFIYAIGLKTVYEKVWYGSDWFRPSQSVFVYEKGVEGDTIYVFTGDHSVAHKYEFDGRAWYHTDDIGATTEQETPDSESF